MSDDLAKQLRAARESGDPWAAWHLALQAAERIEKLDAALREIASISKIICKSEDMSDALLLTLKSHRDLAIKALDDAP